MKKQKRVAKRKQARAAKAIISVPVPPNKPWELTRDEIDIVKKSIAPGATDEELRYCLAVARRYRLDPFRAQIWFVPRKRNDERIWVPIVGINGLQHIAARDHQDYGSVSEPEFGDMKEVSYSYNGRVQKLRAPEWAKVAVWKKGDGRATTATVWWDEIYPEIDAAPLVRRMPRLMLAKCARAQAIRAAYPATDGLYLAEEFAGMRPDYTREGREIIYPDAPRFSRVLDENAPHGHPPGSEKAKQAEEQLRKVELADKEFAADRLQAAPQNAPTGSQVAKPSLPVDRVPRGEVGHPPGIPPKPASPPSRTSVEANRKLPEKRTPTASGIPNSKEIASPADVLNFKTQPPKAQIPFKVKAVKWTPNSRGLEVELDTGKKLYCFDNKRMGEDREELFNILLVSPGKECIFLTKKSQSKDKREFTQIVGLLKMGDREWDETGVPILRREPATSQTEGRQPGDDEEEWLK